MPVILLDAGHKEIVAERLHQSEPELVSIITHFSQAFEDLWQFHTDQPMELTIEILVQMVLTDDGSDLLSMLELPLMGLLFDSLDLVVQDLLQLGRNAFTRVKVHVSDVEIQIRRIDLVLASASRL